MCSVNGALINKDLSEDKRAEFQDILKKVMCKSTDRGVDGFGYASLNFDGSVVEDRFVTEDYISVKAPRSDKVSFVQNKILESTLVNGSTSIVISNLRAEPTTEHQDRCLISDIQPYSYKTIYAIHNGTICNDKQLLKDIDRPTRIDSFAIPYCVATNRVRELDGAIATAWFDTTKIGELHVAKNFAPLEVYYLYDFNSYIFTSLPKFAEPVFKELNVKFNHINFKPFRELIISDSGIKEKTFYNVEEESYNESQSKAVIICSGGLDSTVAATYACHKPYKEVTLLHFLYGCRAEKREVECVKNITEYLKDKFTDKKIKCEFIDLSFIKNLGGSTIVDGTDSDIGAPIEGSEKDIDWVPARNTAFIGLIAAYCDRWNIGNIYMGLNLEEAGAYRDNQTLFMEKFNEVLELGCHSKPVIRSCLENLVKHEIVKLGVELGAPLHLTWSCYRDHDKPCGNCGPCSLRRLAFKINGLEDPQEYEQDTIFDYERDNK